MKLTPQEQKICDEYGKKDKNGYVHCNECPLCIYNGWEHPLECYATIDGRTEKAKKLRRIKN